MSTPLQDQLLDAALRYAELGYPVFPCVPGGKTPLTEHGFKDATTDPDQIRAWWEKHPLANVAIATAGLLVLDVDGASNAWPTEPGQASSLGTCPVMARTPRGGSHRWYRQLVGRSWRNTSGGLGPNVDTRADGGYVVVPPSYSSEHGASYRWVEGMELDCQPAGLPEPPGWLVERLDEIAGPKRVRPDPASLMPGAALADGNPIPEGYRDNTLTSLAGGMRRVGMTEPEIYAALARVNADRCRPPLDDKDVRRIAHSVARYEPHQGETAAAEHHFEQLVARGDGGREPDSGTPIDPGPFPEHLLRVPGFIGDVMAYTLATSHRPLPTLALAGALALMSVLTGRKVRDEANCRTNVYVFGVAPSGGGKDWPREVNKKILFEAGGEELIGPEEIASSAGLISAVEQKPACLFQLDELGRHLKTMTDPRNAHLYGIATVLMKLYSSAGTIYQAGGYADTKRNRTLHQPHAVLFATTVPESLYEGLTADSVTNGFLSRVLIFEAGFCEKQRKVSRPLPDCILEAARWWVNYFPPGNLQRERPDPPAVPVTQSAQAVFDYLERESDRRAMTLGPPYGTLWTRAVEKATKLALLYACSCDRERPEIDECAALWACELMDFGVRRVSTLVHTWVSENVFDARRKRILRLITDAGTDGLTATALLKRSRFLTPREREEVLEALASCGDIRIETEPTRGAPRTRYLANTS